MPTAAEFEQASRRRDQRHDEIRAALPPDPVVDYLTEEFDAQMTAEDRKQAEETWASVKLIHEGTHVLKSSSPIGDQLRPIGYECSLFWSSGCIELDVPIDIYLPSVRPIPQNLRDAVDRVRVQTEMRVTYQRAEHLLVGLASNNDPLHYDETIDGRGVTMIALMDMRYLTDNS